MLHAGEHGIVKTFSLKIQDATHAENIEGITSFVGEDVSGSFGILAGHARFMTILVMGLARYRTCSLSVPGTIFAIRTICVSAMNYSKNCWPRKKS